FHPRKPLPEPEVQPAQTAAPAPRQPVAPAAPPQQPSQSLPPTTSQVLAARSHLQRSQGATTPKKSEPAAASRARPVNNAALERLSSITERVQARP
ncbi:DNA polymerase III subunit gamma/tau, partial [Escherichia coli]